MRARRSPRRRCARSISATRTTSATMASISPIGWRRPASGSRSSACRPRTRRATGCCGTSGSTSRASPVPDPALRRILVIRLGALGNIIQSLGPFAAIRAHHRTADVTLLTRAPYADWLGHAPYFDHVWIDETPAWWALGRWLGLRRRLLAGRFERVYDLQTS